MRYNSTPNPFTKYLKERMKKKKKKREQRKRWDLLSCPRRDREREREREIGRTEGREHGDRACRSNSGEGRGQRQAGSDRGRVGFNFQTLNLP